MKELTLKLIEIDGKTARLVVWEYGAVTNIFEGDIRYILNQQLKLIYENGFTKNKFKVRI